MASDSAREFDLIVFGATGYVGRLVAMRLAGASGGAPVAMRWAIAGRDAAKLEEIRSSLAPGNAPAVVIADAGDAASLQALVARTRVVATTVGPYARYGSPLVAACVDAGTHYCDLTGEAYWVRQMIDRHHQRAIATGARIVNCCGFDSIPSDLGTLMVQRAMEAAAGVPAARVTTYIGKTRGGVSGGTAASALELMTAAGRDPAIRAVLADPYALDPGRTHGPDRNDSLAPGYDARTKQLTAPFVMAGINTRIVRRSNALLDYEYGPEFRYEEKVALPATIKGAITALGLSAGLAVAVRAGGWAPFRALVGRRLPKPGEGPTEAQRARGYFYVHLIAEPPVGVVAPTVYGLVADEHADPGYGSTAKMLSESALCLAFDALDGPGGVLTPAAAMGMTLVDRLRAAGLRFEVGITPPGTGS